MSEFAAAATAMAAAIELAAGLPCNIADCTAHFPVVGPPLDGPAVKANGSLTAANV